MPDDLPAPAPNPFRGAALDFYLDYGYYRMQQELFTCQFVGLGERICTTHWLRLDVARVTWGPAQRSLLRRNAHLTPRVVPLGDTAEYEALYARYRAAITFEAAATLADVLFGEATGNVFDTRVLELRDGEKLVAFGVFDQGERTLAGIVNCYDPDYRRQSLGKYLMLLKTDYARQQGLAYYYPGYVVVGNPKFDYKLFACAAATELYDSLWQTWGPFSWETLATQAAELQALRAAETR